MALLKRFEIFRGINTRTNKIFPKEGYLEDALNVVTNDYNDIELRPGKDYLNATANFKGLYNYFTGGYPVSINTTLKKYVSSKWNAITLFGTYAPYEISDSVEWNGVRYFFSRDGSTYKFDSNGFGRAGIPYLNKLGKTQITNGAGGNVTFDYTTNTVSGANLENRERVTFTNAGGSLPAGLSLGQEYYLGEVSSDVYKVYYVPVGFHGISATDALVVDLLDNGTGTHSAVYVASTAGNYRYKVELTLADAQANEQTSVTIESDTIVGAGGQSGHYVTITPAETFANFKVVFGYVVSSNLDVGSDFTVKAGHNISIGDWLYFYDYSFTPTPVWGKAPVVLRKVTNVVGNTITIQKAFSLESLQMSTGLVSNVTAYIYLDYWTVTDKNIFYPLGARVIIPNASTAIDLFLRVDGIATGKPYTDKESDWFPVPYAKTCAIWQDVLFIGNITPKELHYDPAGNLLGISTSERESNILAWSDTTGDDRATIESFNASLENSTIIGTEEDGEITAIRTNNEALVILKERAIYVMSGTVGTNNLVTRKLEGNTIGCSTHNSIQEIGNVLFFLSETGVFAFQVGQVKCTELSEAIKPLLDDTGLLKSAAVSCHDYKRRWYVLHIPHSTPANAITLVYDYYRNGWWVWKSIDASGGMIYDGNNIQLVDSTGKHFKLVSTLYRDEVDGTPANDVKIDAYIKWPWETINNPSMQKKFKGIKIYSLYCSANMDLNVKCYTDWESTARTDENVTLSVSPNVVITEEIKVDSGYRQAKCLSTKISNATTNQKFAITGIEVELEDQYFESKKFSKD